MKEAGIEGLAGNTGNANQRRVGMYRIQHVVITMGYNGGRHAEKSGFRAGKPGIAKESRGLDAIAPIRKRREIDLADDQRIRIFYAHQCVFQRHVGKVVFQMHKTLEHGHGLGFREIGDAASHSMPARRGVAATVTGKIGIVADAPERGDGDLRLDNHSFVNLKEEFLDQLAAEFGAHHGERRALVEADFGQ